MDTEAFRLRGKEMVDYMCDYMNTLQARPVMSSVEPGYMRHLIPDEPPQEPEPWGHIMKDVDNIIMPGVTHWQHPRFHAYFPSGNSYPSILGDMLSDIIGCIGFSWVASPACTELETIVLDWLAKAIGLPVEFHSTSDIGGGVIQGSSSDCVLVAMLAARAKAVKRLHEENGNEGSSTQYVSRLVAYCSSEAHSCVEKAGLISFVQIRILEPDQGNSLRGETLKKAIEEDRRNKLVPFFISATLGSTGSCSFDNIAELGPVAKDYDCWLHVDAAYAGCAFICPEYRELLQGIEYADSFNTNPNKFLLTNFDCSCFWVKDANKLFSALTVDPLYLQHEHQDHVIDYRHWGIPLSRRFRALKLWFVIRTYGVRGLQKYIRNHAFLAKLFEVHVNSDSRFEVLNNVRMGLVCFRLKEEDHDSKWTVQLLTNINHSRKLHMIPARVQGKIIIRFCVVAEHATKSDIDYAWDVISHLASDLLAPGSPRRTIPLTPEGRRLARQLSFTCPVPQAVISSTKKSSLYDGATPIIVADDTDNCFDDVFDMYLANKESNKEE